MTRKGDWIPTWTGRQVWPLDMRPDDIDIADIAHMLSLEGRWHGRTRDLYSVAQHSVLVSQVCAPADALWGLLHDASEAYIRDLPRPVKHLPEFAVYRDIEAGIMSAVCARFGLPAAEPASVKAADDIVMATEARDLIPDKGTEWERWLGGLVPLRQRISPWGPGMAEWFVLHRFNELVAQRESVRPAA